MTEASKARRREWQRENPEKMREYARNRLRRKYLAEFLEERQKELNLGKEGTCDGKVITT